MANLNDLEQAKFAADGTVKVSVGTVAAAALADAAANPTTTVGGTDINAFNGTTWDRVRTATADALAATGVLASGLIGFNGTTWDRLRVTANKDLLVQQRPAVGWVSATGTSGAAVTLTIPAAAAGVFNYVVYLQIVQFAVALLTAGATPVLVTTTGMTGTPTFSFGASAQAQGTTQEQKYENGIPTVGSAAATTVTVVCPATTNVIWRVNAAYFTA